MCLNLRNKITNLKILPGFTLAEVLITLGIIGIIASLTIPSLVLNTQKQEFTSTLRKQYVTLSKALLNMSRDMGCTGDMLCTGLFDSTSSAKDLGDALIPYIHVIQNCGLNTNQGCFPNGVTIYYDGSGTRSNSYDSNALTYKFITIDGSSIFLGDASNDCTSNSGLNSLSQTCGTVTIDVNGSRGPNNWGRDIFAFFITRTGLLYPNGGEFHQNSGTSQYWKTLGACQPASSSTQSGKFCTGRVMDEGWQMNY